MKNPVFVFAVHDTANSKKYLNGFAEVRFITNDVVGISFGKCPFSLCKGKNGNYYPAGNVGDYSRKYNDGVVVCMEREDFYMLPLAEDW